MPCIAEKIKQEATDHTSGASVPTHDHAMFRQGQGNDLLAFLIQTCRRRNDTQQNGRRRKFDVVIDRLAKVDTPLYHAVESIIAPVLKRSSFRFVGCELNMMWPKANRDS